MTSEWIHRVEYLISKSFCPSEHNLELQAVLIGRPFKFLGPTKTIDGMVRKLENVILLRKDIGSNDIDVGGWGVYC